MGQGPSRAHPERAGPRIPRSSSPPSSPTGGPSAGRDVMVPDRLPIRELPRIMNAHRGNGRFSPRRQREVAVDQPKQRTRFPDRKISETFLDFADPLLAPLGPRATIAQMEQALEDCLHSVERRRLRQSQREQPFPRHDAEPNPPQPGHRGPGRPVDRPKAQAVWRRRSPGRRIQVPSQGRKTSSPSRSTRPDDANPFDGHVKSGWHGPLLPPHRTARLSIC